MVAVVDTWQAAGARAQQVYWRCRGGPALVIVQGLGFRVGSNTDAYRYRCKYRCIRGRC